jgi:hypothetical protein
MYPFIDYGDNFVSVKNSCECLGLNSIQWTFMPGSYGTAVLKDFDSLKIMRPDSSQSWMFIKYLIYCCFHSWKQTHRYQCDCLFTSDQQWWHKRVHENEVPMVPRYSQKYSVGQSNGAKIVKRGCYLVWCNLSYNWQKNKQKAIILIQRNKAIQM